MLAPLEEYKVDKTDVEITGVQSVLYTYSDHVLSRSTLMLGTYKNYRLLAKDPTVALAKGILVSGVLAGSWSVESDEGVSEDRVKFIEDLLIPMREFIMQNVVSYGRVNFGWQGFEKVFGIVEGKLTLTKLKPLLHDMTVILIDGQGNFAGYKQQNMQTAIPVILPVEKCVHIAFDVEGAGLYGKPLLENVRAAQTSWDDCNAGAKRYDKKLAGSHFVVHYPSGTSEVDGETVQNSEIANQLLSALESSGSMAMPSTTADYVQELNDLNVAKLYQWEVTILSDTSARQPTFLKRLQYLDVQKVRGLGLPEKTILEGQFGSRAEASAHIGMAMTSMTLLDQAITREVNTQVVNQLLELNFGAATIGSVRLVAAPLIDTEAAFLRKLYLALVKTDERGTIDTESLKDQLHIPSQKMDLNKEPNNEQSRRA